jgi:exosortase
VIEDPAMSSSPLVTPTRLPVRRGTPPTPLVALARDAFGDPARRWTLLGAVAAFAILLVMYGANIQHFVYIWSSDENYSHGFLVPLIGLYFANEAARRGPVAIKAGSLLGASLIGLAVLGRLATVVVPVGFVGDLSLLIGAAGIVSLLFGRDALIRYGFAIAFLVFMIPLPVALYAKIASPLQLMVSQVATLLLNISGIPALCEGNMITLPGDHKMFVAEACSGMRQLTGFLALTTAWAYLVARPGWYRLVLIASSVPIAMTANIVRVTLTGMISYHIDPRFTSGAFHTVEGLLMMAFGLMMLYGGCWILDRIAGVAPRPGSRLSKPIETLSEPVTR